MSAESYHDADDRAILHDERDEANDKALFAKCEVDPIKAQDDALIAVSLKMRGETGTVVNEFTVDESRKTMVRSNYAPDWTRAHWDHPLLANLKNLSCLSSSDLPSHTKRGLVDERRAIENNNNNNNNNSEGDRGDAAVAGGGAAASAEALAVVPATTEHVQTASSEIADPESLQHAIAHGVTATVEISPFMLRQKALLELSSATISEDPQLLALVSAVAQANKSDPNVAGRVAMGETPTIPVNVLTPSLRTTFTGNKHRRACDALPVPSYDTSVTSRGFHDSDIVAYERIADELSPSRHHQRLLAVGDEVAQSRDDQQQPANDYGANADEGTPAARIAPLRPRPPSGGGGDAASSSSPTSPARPGSGAPAAARGSGVNAVRRSMHDVGYKTWCQRHLEQPSEHEDMERYAEYREAVTSLEGKAAACVHMARHPELSRRVVIENAVERSDETVAAVMVGGVDE